MADTPSVNRGLARGQLHRLVRWRQNRSPPQVYLNVTPCAAQNCCSSTIVARGPATGSVSNMRQLESQTISVPRGSVRTAALKSSSVSIRLPANSNILDRGRSFDAASLLIVLMTIRESGVRSDAGAVGSRTQNRAAHSRTILSASDVAADEPRTAGTGFAI